MPSSRAATLELAPPSALPLARVGVLAARAGALAFAALVPISIAGMQIALGVALAGVVLARAGGVRASGRSFLDLPVLLLTGAAFLSVLLAWAAGTPPASLFRATLWKTFLTPLVVARALALALPGEPADAPRGRAVAALAAWAGGALVVGAVAIVQPWTGFDPLFFLHTTPIRITAERAGWPGGFHALGFFGQYAVLPVNLVPLLALAAGVAALAPIGAARRRLLGAGAAAASVASILSLTRTAWLALAVVSAVLVVAGRRRTARALAGAAVVAVLALAVPGVRTRLVDGVSLAANADRAFMWEVCGEIRRDHPLTGVGLGNFGKVAGPYFDRRDPAWVVRTACHDVPLTFLVEGGPLLLAASALWLVLLARGLLRAHLAATAAGDALGRAAAAGALAALAGTLANALFHDVFHASEAAYAIGLALGVGAVLAGAVDGATAARRNVSGPAAPG
jgi:O-antigen ligase